MIKRIIGAIKRRYRWFYRYADPKLVSFCSRRRGFSSIYYFLWNRSFSRELHGVLAGRSMFNDLIRRPKNSSSLLRRNTHRIEKGILSRPRRGLFALDYIEETVNCFLVSSKEEKKEYRVSDAELQWANDVLKTYFEITDPHPLLDELGSRYKSQLVVIDSVRPDRNTTRVPYLRDIDQETSVKYEDLLELAKRRRSVRWFEQRPVPRENIRKAVAVAAQSPSACNRQPFEFRVFDSPDLVRKVADLPAGTSGFSHNFPCVIVVVGQLRNYFDERDRHLIYIDASLAVMSLILALESEGIGSCCINWPDIPEREEMAKQILDLKKDERPIMFIAVGYPDPEGLVAYSEKKPIDQLCKFNFE